MYRYLVVSLEQIDRVVFADFVKMNNVPEVPTDDGFALCQRCNGYVQGIRQRSSRNDAKLDIDCSKLQSFNADFFDAG